MSFSADVKDELISVEIEKNCCLHAFCYGLLLCSRSFSYREISILTEHRQIAEKYADTINKVCSVSPCIVKSDAGKYRVEIENAEDRAKIMAKFGYDTKLRTMRINYANIADDCCKSAFLRGVFLSCGTVNDPNKRYHLEFVLPYKNLIKDLAYFISGFEEFEKELEPKIIQRNSNYVMYFKGSEVIEDILTAMGAVTSSLNVMGVKMYKDMRNNVNRKLNFESANLDKTVSAASKQIEAIRKIKNTVGLSFLPEELREIAILRYDNPDMSLRELSENLKVSLSRSGVNHRLKKICDIADSIK
ncbi:MAG: DNA-binding protein WhiA [Oscillospiraceae bacterium]|nr:DNA-binding protein WhiA [Oscillospiraceae bacterium]